jgi:integrase
MSVLVRCKNCGNFYSKKCKCGVEEKAKAYYVQYKLPTGKRKLVFASNSLIEARQMDNEYKYTHKLDEKVNSITFKEYIDKYFTLHFYSKNKAAEKAQYMIDRFYSVFKDYPLDSIKPFEIEGAILEFTSGKSSSSLNNHISTIHRIFEYALELELINKNPVKIRKSRKDNARRRFLNLEERKAILKACKESESPYLYEMVYISLYSGLRLGEIQALKREDVREGFIYVLSDTAKSKKGRPVPIPDHLEELLKTASFDYDYDIKTAWNTAKRRCGILDIRFHDLRRTYGSMLAQAGVPIFNISKLMGHSNTEITSKVYAHLLPDNLINSVAMLPKV